MKLSDGSYLEQETWIDNLYNVSFKDIIYNDLNFRIFETIKYGHKVTSGEVIKTIYFDKSVSKDLILYFVEEIRKINGATVIADDFSKMGVICSNVDVNEHINRIIMKPCKTLHDGGVIFGL